jgi:cell division septation protein DedD
VTSRSSDGSGLGSKHVIFLAMMSAWLAVVVFLLGVMVGRDVSILEMVTGQEAAGAAEESLALDDQPFVASTTRREPSMAATDGHELSYFSRLDDESGPELDAHLAVSPATAAEAAAPVDGGDVGSPIPSDVSAERPDGYALQVTTLRERDAAERMAQGLVEKGYPAFVVLPAPGVPVAVFRVRVGTYTERDEAEQVLRRLEGEESLKPWITR